MNFFAYKYNTTMKNIAILLILAGFLLLAAGLLILIADKIPWLGNLPGDIHLQGKIFHFVFRS